MEKATPYSSLKVFAHHDTLMGIENGERVAPIYVRFKPTNVCNHRCYYCSYADEKLGLRNTVNRHDMIPREKALEIVSDFAELGVKGITLSGGGEPLTYPHIVELMKKILSMGIDLSLITNGSLLNEERAQILRQAKWVRISCDAAQADTYAKIRNVPNTALPTVFANIEEFAKIKNNDCELGINYVVHHENAAQVYEMVKRVKELGINHIKFSARVTKDLFAYHAPFRNKVVEDLHRAVEDFSDERFINKYESDFDSALVFHRDYDTCYINRMVTCVAADSKVYFCHDKAYTSSGVVGDLQQKTFKDLWLDEAVIKRYKEFDCHKECNHHCVYDDRNILLNTYFSLDKSQINFV